MELCPPLATDVYKLMPREVCPMVANGYTCVSTSDLTVQVCSKLFVLMLISGFTGLSYIWYGGMSPCGFEGTVETEIICTRQWLNYN